MSEQFPLKKFLDKNFLLTFAMFAKMFLCLPLSYHTRFDI